MNPFFLCNKSRGEEYRIGNVGDLYFYTFWWIQWFAMLGNFWFWYRGLNLESWVDIWSHKDWSSEIGIGQGNNAEKETTESFLELLCTLYFKPEDKGLSSVLEIETLWQNSPGLNPEFSQIAEFRNIWCWKVVLANKLNRIWMDGTYCTVQP